MTTADATAGTVAAEDTRPDAATETTTAAVPDIDARARRMGWRPKDEFRGNPADWIDASAYVEKGENELPVLRDQLRRQDQKFVKTERELAEVKGKLDESTTTLTELAALSRKAEERAYAKARRELQSELDEAASKADVQEVRRVTQEIQQLDADKPAAKPATATTSATTAAPAIPAEVTLWVNAPDQAWYRENAALRDEAVALHGSLARSRPDLTLAQNLAETRRKMSVMYPDQFTNTRREQPSAVASPSPSPTPRRPAKKGYDDLPTDAKRACDKFIKTIPGYKREDYIATYFAGEE